MENKLEIAFGLFDKANKNDPNKETSEGKIFPKELLYSIRMTNKLNEFSPNATEVVQLAARCQHICRWEIPRDSFEMNRNGYLTWRRELAKFHAKKASEILEEVGYSTELIDKVAFLVQKKQLKRNKETQLLEDVICLVFLEFYFEKFSEKYSEDKLVDILRKTWAKMSDKGQDAALKLNLSSKSFNMLKKALA